MMCTGMIRIWACLLAVCLLACCGPGVDELTEKSYGDKGMTRSILIAYGSWAGSTAQVADFIAKTLAEGGARVDVKPIESVKSLDGYSAVVIGSAIRVGKVKPEVMDFVKDHASELKKIPAAYFIVCMTMKDDTPGNRKTVNAYLDPLREVVGPFDAGLFAGKMDYARLGFFTRIAVQYFVKVPQGDFRNWDAIRAWAESVHPRLIAGGNQP